jgi:hypothetical protein
MAGEMPLIPDLEVGDEGLGAFSSKDQPELDEWDMPIFAFQDLDYIPSGYGGILAPYIETGPGSEFFSPNLFIICLISGDWHKLHLK